MRIQLAIVGTLMALVPPTTEAISGLEEPLLAGTHEQRAALPQGNVVTSASDDPAEPVVDFEAEPPSTLSMAPPALPNLQVIGISHSSYRYWDGTYSVAFNVQVKNVGAAGTVRSFSVGARGWAGPTIFTCTGGWCSQNTTLAFAAGETRTVRVYGPGYVGPRLHPGVSFTVVAYADPYCSIAESSESDNSRSKLIVAGY